MQERDRRIFVSMSLSGQEGTGSSEQLEGLALDSRRERVHYNTSSENRIYTGNWVIWQ